MIKLNFNSTKTSAGPTYEKTTETGFSTSFTSISTINQDIISQLKVVEPRVLVVILLKFLFILAFPVCLKVYEVIHIRELEAVKVVAQKNLDKKKQNLQKVEKEIASYSYLDNKSAEFESKKDFIKKLSESRLIIPRTLDSIQTNIPKTVWLKGVEVAVGKDKSVLKIKGESLTEDSVNSFADSLKSFVDRPSIKLTTRDIKEQGSTVRVSFDLKADMLSGRGF